MLFECPECYQYVEEEVEGYCCRDCLFKKGKNVQLQKVLPLFDEFCKLLTRARNNTPVSIDELRTIYKQLIENQGE